jgi:MoaA/NifB/PqqE/SkfB family radical SAM enzyme
MCDIWKGNSHLKRLTEEDIRGLLDSLKKLGTRQALMSGGEALLNPDFFLFCRILKQQHIRVTLLSTGLTLKKNAEQLLRHVHHLILSLDGDEFTHDYIRNIPGAYQKLKEGVRELKTMDPSFRISCRTVIHKLNFRQWPRIIDSAHEIGLDGISFLPADVSSHAFNREILWNEERTQEIAPSIAELAELSSTIEKMIESHKDDFETGFIAESPEKLRHIGKYYAALHGLEPFPYKKCNAPWVSTVVEADGTVRPCFFHEAMGNIRQQSLEKIVNDEKSIRFRKELDMDNNMTCVKCVCYLNLAAHSNPV